jgi:peptidoglycan/xylan/chitin deacetylase (PgdA/CDA1 family)
VRRPAGLHESLAALLDRTGALGAAIQLRRAAPISTISIVTFHRIAEIADEDPYDPDVVDATPAQFRRHVETLARFGTPVGIDALLRAFEGGRLPPNPVMITFDDGYRSCRDVALPILRRLGVPATFFIATGFPGSRRLYWWEQIATIVRSARGRSAELSYPRPMRIDASDPGARRLLCDAIKDTPGLDVGRFLTELRGALGVPWSDDLEAGLSIPLIMSWDDIRALAGAGMDVESHTRTHRVLETLSGDELRDELVGSRRDLEAELCRPVRAIAYPVGRCPPRWVRREVAAAGYRLGLTNTGGVNTMWPAAMASSDPLEIRRLPTERTQSDALFLTQLAVPQLEAVRRGLALPRAAAVRRSRRPPPPR